MTYGPQSAFRDHLRLLIKHGSAPGQRLGLAGLRQPVKMINRVLLPTFGIAAGVGALGAAGYGVARHGWNRFVLGQRPLSHAQKLRAQRQNVLLGGIQPPQG